MKINFDPVIVSRLKQAWDKLPVDQRARMAPMLLKAHQQALTLTDTGVAPTSDPTVPHQILLAQSAMTDDRDGVAGKLEAGVVVHVAPDGVIWGTGKYQSLDPAWTEALAVCLESFLTGKHPFLTTPKTFAIPNAVQIGIAGDWGTGDWRTAANPAPSTDVKTHMAFLQPNLTIHLGDVYYAGTSDQEKHLLVDIWPRGSLGSLTLNSNHEMYSGAKPYFDQALTSSAFSFGVPLVSGGTSQPEPQTASYFALENDNWVVVGLDSAYYSDGEHLYMDGSLYPSSGPQVQLDFLREQVAKNKKMLLLTHHNGLTDDGSATNTLWTQVMSAFPQGEGPDYWYWGHVHAGIVYKPQPPQAGGPGQVLCRCSGHAALPWGEATELAGKPNVLWYETRSAKDPDIPERVLNGFTMLYLDGPEIDEVFYDENGGVAWANT
ncbi:MAG TPA: metallophosphoesterase [Terriglobia bacterium]|nr:metallophosphoesterase [Terriglobia bacterium]